MKKSQEISKYLSRLGRNVLQFLHLSVFLHDIPLLFFPYMYIRRHSCINVCMYTHLYGFLYTRPYMHINIHVSKCMHIKNAWSIIYVSEYMCEYFIVCITFFWMTWYSGSTAGKPLLHMHTYICKYTRLHTYAHTYISLHIRAYIHT